MVSKTVTRIICAKKEFNKLGEEPETLRFYSGSILFSLAFRKIFNIFYDIDILNYQYKYSNLPEGKVIKLKPCFLYKNSNSE